MKTWLNCHPKHVRITLHIQPGAKKSGAVGEHGDALKVRLQAPPVDGKANSALILWLSDRLHVPKRQIQIISGDKSRHKIVEIEIESTEDAILQALMTDR